jgi:hypothetical protein
MLPAKTLASKKEAAAPGYKKSKEQVTILACSNATGNHKLRLTLIGKSKKPRAFKKLKKSGITAPILPTSKKAKKKKTYFFSNKFLKRAVQ